ncbi:MAG: ParB N-terminal domain-containing protein [Acidimicrobiia bacterium]|nr:ParB N-terminal domain-containing protein [Acidimicrobiia bacterium]
MKGSTTPRTTMHLVERLAQSDKLSRRRYELLPVTGPDAAFTEPQARGPAESMAPASLEDLVSNIGQVGVLQPILVEELPNGDRRIIAGERRMRACRFGALAQPGNPHFQSIPAVVCPGPLAEEEWRVWQLAENLAREDLQPGELAAALLFERCALLTQRLLDAGTDVPGSIRHLEDPVERFAALDRLRRDHRLHQTGAPWADVLRRLGLALSPTKAERVVRAFRQLPGEISADMDAHKIALTTRLGFCDLHSGQAEAAEGIWEAVKARNRTDLLARAVDEQRSHPHIDAEKAVDLAAEYHVDADERRTATCRANRHGQGVDPGCPGVSDEVVDAATRALHALLKELRSGRRPSTYLAGSLRLHARELLDLLDTGTREDTNA